ncbi:coiled coil protein [Legionella donaldsonii]|uniref:Coiled coil protein n=1 Tax=Legionella donaldsonii TaxID=45060 RepID=A0A378J0W3_9GAMM|nr:hypothetical protein [Legionella donaldsonii]STX40631.1 coiled coil protein [Legionella donaldsonii]
MLGSVKRYAQPALDSGERIAKVAINFLDKVFGAIAGVTLFSLTSLMLNLLMSLALLAFTLTVRVALPIAAAFWAYKVTHSFSMTLFSTVMALGLNRLILPPLLVIGSVRLVLKAIEDLAYTVPYGLTEGYNKGLVHVVKQWWKIPFSFFSYLRAEDENAQAINQDFFDLPTPSFNLLQVALQRSFTHPQPVAKDKLTRKEYDDLEIVPASTEFEPLTADELERASKIGELSTVLTQYTSLNNRLNDLEAGTLDDELIVSTPIEKPILLVKQELQSGEWKAVPAYTKISDRESLWRWVSTDATNPFNRDSLVDTATTRYRYNVYQGKGSSQELREAAETIRQRLLTPVNNAVASSDGYLALLSGFFATRTGSMSAPVVNHTKSPDTAPTF